MVKILPGTELPTLLKYSLWRYYVRTAISLLVGWALWLMKLSNLLVYVLYVLPYQKQARAFCWPSMEVYKIFLNLDMQSRCWMNVAITLRVLIISVSGLWMQNKAAKNLGITWNCLAVCHKFKGDKNLSYSWVNRMWKSNSFKRKCFPLGKKTPEQWHQVGTAYLLVKSLKLGTIIQRRLREWRNQQESSCCG